MPRLPGVSQQEAVRVFQKLGYRVVRESGHLIMSNRERRLVIPRHDPINAITMGAICSEHQPRNPPWFSAASSPQG
ncbi:MAG: addiction module toxin, HicA family [Synechococcaceae bacterium WB9_2_112]|nr:addiction module toxin, HicA family [Synechococcaceae bacterium WB9_2_112]